MVEKLRLIDRSDRTLKAVLVNCETELAQGKGVDGCKFMDECVLNDVFSPKTEQKRGSYAPFFNNN